MRRWRRCGSGRCQPGCRPTSVREKSLVLSLFDTLTMIILPRQARDRHREGTQKQRERRFCAGARDAIVRETITDLVEKATRPTTTGVGGHLMSMSSADAIEAEAGSTGGGGGGGGRGGGDGAASVALYRSLSQQYLEALQGEGLLEPLHVALALPLCDSVEAVERAATTIARTRSSGNDAVRPHATTQPRNHATTQPRKRVSASKRSILDGCASSCPHDDDREHSSRSQSQSSQHSLRLTHNARYPRACRCFTALSCYR
jgi:hypothetical protein